MGAAPGGGGHLDMHAVPAVPAVHAVHAAHHNSAARCCGNAQPGSTCMAQEVIGSSRKPSFHPAACGRARQRLARTRSGARRRGLPEHADQTCQPLCYSLPLQGKAATGLYEKWSKKTRLRVATSGAEEPGARLAAQMADRCVGWGFEAG